MGRYRSRRISLGHREQAPTYAASYSGQILGDTEVATPSYACAKGGAPWTTNRRNGTVIRKYPCSGKYFRTSVFGLLLSVFIYIVASVQSVRIWKRAQALYSMNFCHLDEDPVGKVDFLLRNRLVGQPAALTAIQNGIQRFHSDVMEGEAHPLILALVGPSGTGKTMAGETIGEAVLEHVPMNPVSIVWNSWYDGAPPNGFLVVRGEEFSDPSVPVNQYQQRLLQRIATHLRKCGGKGVVLIDEAGKIPANVLDLLVSSIKGYQCRLHTPEQGTVSCDETVFILTADMQTDEVRQMLLKGHTKQIQARILREVLQRKWEGLSVGNLVNSIIPFTPFGPADLALVLNKHLYRWALRTSVLPVAKFALMGRRKEWTELVDTSRTTSPKNAERAGYHRIEFSPKISKLLAACGAYTRIGANGSILYNDAGARSAVEFTEGPLRSFRRALERALQNRQPFHNANSSAFKLLQVHTSKHEGCEFESGNTDLEWYTHWRNCYSLVIQYCVTLEYPRADGASPDEVVSAELDVDGSSTDVESALGNYFRTGWSNIAGDKCSSMYKGPIRDFLAWQN
eukprot:gb/GECG01006282.1/.p1 GENE.gb/GECG01006282.1/~~gb/GECG01006282.1/.p1  ORF type:complete len:569 (+),score=41.78 gb/GECG01006282.1/:1-1707(+)